MADEKEVSKEYPRSLYMNGDRNSAHRVVNDADEEKGARDEGFKNLDEVEAKKPKGKK